ncbi:hypothetical protein Tco_1481191 [Tanacetum coccineum]
MKSASRKLDLVLDCTVTDMEDRLHSFKLLSALTSRAHRYRNTTSKTLASIAIETSVSLNCSLSQSISHSLGYQCPDGSIIHWGGGCGSGSGEGGSGSSSGSFS